QGRWDDLIYAGLVDALDYSYGFELTTRASTRSSAGYNCPIRTPPTPTDIDSHTNASGGTTSGPHPHSTPHPLTGAHRQERRRRGGTPPDGASPVRGRRHARGGIKSSTPTDGPSPGSATGAVSSQAFHRPDRPGTGPAGRRRIPRAAPPRARQDLE